MDRYALDMVSPVPAYGDMVEGATRLAARPTTLDGKIVGLLPNWRPSAAEVLKAVGAELQRRFNLKDVVFEQPVRELPITRGKVIDSIRERLDNLVTRVDVVITASGD